MLQFLKAKKGQEEIASFFAILMFAAVALVIFGVLNFTSGSVEQKISGEFGDTDLREALLVYLKTYDQSGRNMADVMVEMMNKEDAGENADDPLLRQFIKTTFDYFEYDPDLAYIIAISDAKTNKIYYMFDNRERFEDRNKIFPGYWSEVGKLPDLKEVSVFIPNPNGGMKNIKVSLVNIPVI